MSQSASPADPAPNPRVVVSRVAINAANAEMAALTAGRDYVVFRARQAGLHAYQDPDAFERPGAQAWRENWNELLRDDRPLDAPVAGYWVTLTRWERQSGPPESPEYHFQNIAIRVEALPEPHREPLAFGSTETRPTESLRAETLAYWEAMDLRSAVSSNPASPAPGPARL